MRVFVYFNLHRKLWSVKALSGENKGRVIGHYRFVEVSSPRLKVSEAGRQRVLREGRKNVHAGVEGVLLTCDPQSASAPPDYPMHRVTYNPRKYATFVRADDASPAQHAVFVRMFAPIGNAPSVQAWGINQ